MVSGKVQSGVLSKGQTLLLMPNKTKVVADMLMADDTERAQVQSGINPIRAILPMSKSINLINVSYRPLATQGCFDGCVFSRSAV